MIVGVVVGYSIDCRKGVVVGRVSPPCATTTSNQRIRPLPDPHSEKQIFGVAGGSGGDTHVKDQDFFFLILGIRRREDLSEIWKLLRKLPQKFLILTPAIGPFLEHHSLQNLQATSMGFCLKLAQGGEGVELGCVKRRVRAD